MEDAISADSKPKAARSDADATVPTETIVIPQKHPSSQHSYRPPEVDDNKNRAVHMIRLSALQHNYECVESAAARQRCSVITVVKADGYGHGALATALHLADSCGADAFAVATLEEAIALRKAFAQNPPATTPFDVTLADAWTSPQLQGITSLSQFAALVIVTDNANSARAWIEQTSATRGTIPVVVISSAQAAPMIQPYYDSQQVSGLVTGLYGGAVLEQKNGTVSGTTRRYWDAYSIGMYLAMVLILGGGLLNLALGLRDRAAVREAK